jgi:hypothetical protein
LHSRLIWETCVDIIIKRTEVEVIRISTKQRKARNCEIFPVNSHASKQIQWRFSPNVKGARASPVFRAVKFKELTWCPWNGESAAASALVNRSQSSHPISPLVAWPLLYDPLSRKRQKIQRLHQSQHSFRALVISLTLVVRTWKLQVLWATKPRASRRLISDSRYVCLFPCPVFVVCLSSPAPSFPYRDQIPSFHERAPFCGRK